MEQQIKYGLIKDMIDLVADFENQNADLSYKHDIQGFQEWVKSGNSDIVLQNEPDWEGKQSGRSPESVINTLLVHMNRFAKTYSKAAIWGSEFSTQEDFIYLINLQAFGEMTKMELIKRNIHDKPAGILVINRLIKQGWGKQEASLVDKRSHLISITDIGLEALENQMGKIRQATEIVTGNLNYQEKMDLIRLLNKLNDYHLPIYEKNISPSKLLEEAQQKKTLETS